MRQSRCSPSSNRTCGFPASGFPAGIPRFRFRFHQPNPSFSRNRHSASGNMADQWSLSCSRNPSLHRHYPASPLLRFPPTPGGGDDGPRQLCPLPPGLPGYSTSLSLRAVSSHPGRPTSCTQVSLRWRLQASSNPEDWPPPLCVTRPNRVQLRYGSQVRRTGLHLGDCSFRCRIGYMLDTYLTC